MRLDFVQSALLVGLCAPILSFGHPAGNNSPYLLRVAHQMRGILTVSFDPAKPLESSLQVLATTPAGVRPGWLTPRGDMLYSVSRTKFPDNSSTSAGIFSFKKDNSSAGVGLRLISSASADGDGGVYCGVSGDGRTLAAAELDGSTVSIHALTDEGVVGNSTQIFKYEISQPGPGLNDSQIAGNPHETAFDPSGRYMFVPDRGADRVYVYKVIDPYRVTREDVVELPLGTGPRHVTFRQFNETLTYFYLVSELDNTVRVFSFEPKTQRHAGCEKPAFQIKPVQVATALGPGSNRTEPINHFLASEVALSADGKFAYVSVRNAISLDSDVISVYAVDPSKGDQHLTFVGQSKSYGKIIRHFSLSPDAESGYAAVANQVSNSLTVLARDAETGLMDRLVGNLTLGAFDLTQSQGPMAVIWW